MPVWDKWQWGLHLSELPDCIQGRRSSLAFYVVKVVINSCMYVIQWDGKHGRHSCKTVHNDDLKPYEERDKMTPQRCVSPLQTLVINPVTSDEEELSVESECEEEADEVPPVNSRPRHNLRVPQRFWDRL